MIKKSTLFLLFLILGILTTTFLLFLSYEWEIQRDTLYLKNSRIVISEKTSEGGNLVYYQQDGLTKILPSEEVEHIGYGDASQTTSGEALLSGYVILAKETVKNQIKSGKEKIIRIQNRFPMLQNGNYLWLPLLILVPAAYLIARKFRSTRKKKQEETISNPKTVPESNVPVLKKKEEDQDTSDTIRIVKFFLELFRLQTGAAPDAASNMFPVEAKTIGSNQIYQLRILHNGEWVKRRMSIGPLGEESGSKSKCYYVIYDVHIVVKIPPRPLNDFQAYIDGIKNEGRIVDKLAPKKCIVPKISVILQRIYTFPGAEKISPEKLEEKYIRLLGTRPALQEYLKIGGGFVFFMDLSKYFFLGHIVDNLHDLDQKLNEEIIQNPGIIWDLPGFAGRYGQSNSNICDKMQEIYADFETEIRNWMAALEPPVQVQPYQIRNWYLMNLAGNTVKADEKLLSQAQAEKVNKTVEELFSRNAKEIALYKKVVHKYVRDISFAQNRAQLESISTNILILLAWLGEKKIAMRDLKPDNLLVAGDPTDYPHFLSSVEKFSIGLIDVETAVDYTALEGQKIPQPQLGGTPNYATPTHLFDNPMLSLVYDDLPGIFHLQDWQATIGMIYKVAIGKTLFQKTGKLFPTIVKTIHQSIAEKKPPEIIIKEVNQMFWQCAIEDFSIQIQKKAFYLKSLKLRLSDNIKKMFQKEVSQTNRKIISAIQKQIDSQTAFPGDQNSKQLTTASYQQIISLKAKWENRADSPPSDKSEQIKVLQTLERLKLQSMILTDFSNQLDQPGVKMTVHDILSLMFAVVYNSMHKPEWEPFSPETPRPKKSKKNAP